MKQCMMNFRLQRKRSEEVYGEDGTEDDWYTDLYRNFQQNVKDAEKICDEWFTDEQILDFISKNIKPAETDEERAADEIIKKINELNPSTMSYYYRFSLKWEMNGIAQRIRDIWELPTFEEFSEIQKKEWKKLGEQLEAEKNN